MFISFTIGCQSIPTVNQGDLSAQTASVQSLPEDADHQCEVDKRLFAGSYIATGSNHHNLDQTPDINALTTSPADFHPNLAASDTSEQAEDQEPDLWDLLARELDMKVPNNRTIRYYKRWYVNNPYHVEKVTARAEPFLYYIYQQVNARDLPIELVLLPFVESSFDQFAYSHKGAAGLWQFTEPTGKTFGLEIIKGYDGRRDIVYSTDAALDLLEYLYDKFDGNWLHAIAAITREVAESELPLSRTKSKASQLTSGPSNFRRKPATTFQNSLPWRIWLSTTAIATTSHFTQSRLNRY